MTLGAGILSPKRIPTCGKSFSKFSSAESPPSRKVPPRKIEQPKRKNKIGASKY